jgi:hypothetical protein
MATERAAAQLCLLPPGEVSGPPRTALDLGHVSPHTVFNHYREVVTPEEAERYWNIFPTVLAANVVPVVS